MVADEIALLDNGCKEVAPGTLELDEVFNSPHFVMDYGVDPFLKGFASHKQYETDTKINSVLRNFLFGNATDTIRFGLDLASLNIQRGRDHGLPDYNTVRRYYTGRNASSFADVTSNTVLAASLQKLYGNVNNIDLWVGLLAEDILPGKSVGKTMHAMLKSQFEKLRDCDYYFYKNDPYLPLITQIQLRNTKLSDVIKRNTSITNLQSNVFFIEACPGETGEDRIAGKNLFVSKNPVEENILFKTTDTEIRIYPNPATSIINVDLGNTSEINKIQLLSLNGSLIKTIDPINKKSLQIDVTISLQVCISSISQTLNKQKYSGL